MLRSIYTTTSRNIHRNLIKGRLCVKASTPFNSGGCFNLLHVHRFSQGKQEVRVVLSQRELDRRAEDDDESINHTRSMALLTHDQLHVCGAM